MSLLDGYEEQKNDNSSLLSGYNNNSTQSTSLLDGYQEQPKKTNKPVKSVTPVNNVANTQPQPITNTSDNTASGSLLQDYEPSTMVLQGSVSKKGARTYEDRFPDRKTGVGGFFSNAGADVADTVKGLGQIVGNVGNFVAARPVMNVVKGDKDKSLKEKLFTGEGIQDIKDMWNNAPETLHNLKEGLKENYGQGNVDMWNVQRVKEGKSPLNVDVAGLVQSFHAHPLNLLDVVGVGEVGKIKNVAKVTKGGEVSKFAKTVGNKTLSPKYSENLVYNAGQRLAETKPVQNFVNAVDNSKFRVVTDKVADTLGINPDSRLMGQKGAEVRQAKLIEQANQTKNIAERNKAIAMNNAELGGLTDAEAKAMVQAVESGDSAIFEGNDKLTKVRDKFKQKVDDNAQFYKAQGKLSEETIHDLPINNYASIKYQKPINALTAEEKLEAFKDIQKMPAEQQPFYIPVMYEDRLQASDFFANTTKNYTPGELKHRSVGMGLERNAKGNKRIYDPVELANRLDAHRIKMINTENMVKEIIDNFAEPLDLTKQTVKEGYVQFNPDSFLNFYKKQIDLNDLAIQKLSQMDNIDSALKSAIEESIKGLDKDIVEVLGACKRTQIYQIPEAVAKTLTEGKTAKGMLGQLFDMGTAGFKRKVLGLSPKWFINNRIGNGIMAGLKGVNLSHYKRALNLADELLPESLRNKSLYEAEKTIIGRTGGGDNGKFGKTMRLLGGEFIDTSEIKGIKKAGIFFANSLGVPMKTINKITDVMFSFNQKFEDWERRSAYLHSVDAVGKKMLKEAGQNITKQDELLKAVLNNEDVLNAVMRDVDNTLGDYINMTTFERRTLRKIVPFYSWLRTITRYTLSLAETNPIRANLANKVSMLLAEENENLPEYQQGSVPTNFTVSRTHKPMRLNYEHSIPFSTFAETEENPLGIINPLFTQPLEALAGERFWNNQGLESPYYEKLNGFPSGYASLRQGSVGRVSRSLPMKERAKAIPVGIARTTIPALDWIERVGYGTYDNWKNKGQFKPYDKLFDTGFGGYNYEDGFRKRPAGFDNSEQLLRLFFPLQQEGTAQQPIPVGRLKRKVVK